MDVFNTHNAFRAPGAASIEDLEKQLPKVEFLAQKYSKMHKRIIPHKEHITPDNIELLKEMDYIFLSIDRVSVRKEIAGYLIDKGLYFIDSGLGVNLSENKLSGLVRITAGFPEHNWHIKEAFGGDDAKDDVYASNIQIAELNALAAIHAIIKWKKMLGFYWEEKKRIIVRKNRENFWMLCMNINHPQQKFLLGIFLVRPIFQILGILQMFLKF